MQTEIKHRPAQSTAVVTLAPQESLRAEGGVMMRMADVEIETNTGGGFLKGLRRSMLGGESFFVNTFTAGPSGGMVELAPTLPGDVAEWNLTGETVFVQSGSFLAGATELEIDSSWGGAKTMISRQGLFTLKCSGVGTLLVCSFGSIEPLDLAPGQRYTVGGGHLVGWSGDVQYDAKRVGGWKSTIFSGQGFVAELTGPGRVYLQTRNPENFVQWLIPQLPKDDSTTSFGDNS